MSSYGKKTKEAAEEAPPREMDGVDEFESNFSIRNDTEEDNVIDLHGSRGKRKREMPTNQPHMVPSMSDAPSRTEIAAQLQAAEARTETRIAQLGLVIETRASASDHKLDLLAADMRSLVGVVAELRTDYKETRKAIWTVGIGAVITILGLVVALWIAGINVQANMIAVFQTALGVRSLPQEVETPKDVAPPATSGQHK